MIDDLQPVMVLAPSSAPILSSSRYLQLWNSSNLGREWFQRWLVGARAAVFLFEAFGDTNATHYLPDMSSSIAHLITELADLKSWLVFGVRASQHPKMRP